MMTEIIVEKQLQKPRHSIYCRAYLDESGDIVDLVPFDSRVTRDTVDGKPYIFITDAKGNLRQDAMYYVNDVRKFLSFGTRVQMATAINLFYTFCDICKYDPQNVTGTQISEWMNFCVGSSVYAYQNGVKTIREASTVNQYYGMVKQYFLTNNVNVASFSKTKTVKMMAPMGNERPAEVLKTLDINRLKTNPLKGKTAPMHVTPNQVESMAVMMKENGDFQSLLMSKLQYCYGLRCGEVLGLTEEDFVKEKEDNVKLLYKMILRNRVSDHMDQHCKGLYHPQSVDEYRSSLYRDSCWEIEISKDTYDMVQLFIERSKDLTGLNKKKRQNIKSSMVADSVIRPGNSNHYLFRASTGNRLSSQSWNDRLRKYFEAIGIESDHIRRRTNCSHKLRHGFAMFHAQYSEKPMNTFELQKAMRHSSPSSCARYYNPLPEDERNLRNRFISEIDNLIPDLKWDMEK